MIEKYSPAIPKLIPSTADPSVGVETLGYYIVNDHTEAALAEVNLAQYDEAQIVVERLTAEKKKPEEVGPLRRVIGRMLGSVMTEEEAELVQNMPHFEDDIKLWRAVDETFSKIVENDLPGTRKSIADIEPDNIDFFDEYCEKTLPPYLRKVKAESAGGNTWHSWLTEQADDEQLMNFLQWNIYFTEQQQLDAEANHEIESEREEYKEGIRRGIEEGWLHDDALFAIDQVDNIAVVIGDVFDTQLKDRGGYHTRSTKFIVIGGATNLPAPGDYGSLYMNIKRTAKHEFNHAVLGEFGHRWINEALTEHIASVMKYGQLERVAPNSRRDPFPGAYNEERELLDYLLKQGSREVPVELATRAYSEYPDEDVCYDREKFIDAIDDAWSHLVPEGTSAFIELSFHIESLEEKYVDEGMPPIKAGSRAAKEVLDGLKESPEELFSSIRPKEIKLSFLYEPKNRPE
ncbi:MAG TPA: hypothetical protein VFK11_04200 [Candidatus Saccharimonadales bacterium]|nr:hypothetical protein [Candidatus Saccharimonadales bacterium]